MIKKKGTKPETVIDTNILISSTIAPKGKPNQVIKAWKDGLVSLEISDQILKEVQDVAKRERLINKYRLFPERINRLIETLKVGAEKIIQISAQKQSVSSRDPKDNKLLACALGGKADFLVSGDEDLLLLNGNPKIADLKIVSPSDFLKIIS